MEKIQKEIITELLKINALNSGFILKKTDKTNIYNVYKKNNETIEINEIHFSPEINKKNIEKIKTDKKKYYVEYFENKKGIFYTDSEYDLKEQPDEVLWHIKNYRNVIFREKPDLLGKIDISPFLKNDWPEGEYNQKEFVMSLFKMIPGYCIHGEIVSDTFENDESLEDAEVFNVCNKKKKYDLEYGGSYIVKGSEKHFDGRVKILNDMALDEFWNYDIDKLKKDMAKIDYNVKNSNTFEISVYDKLGKDWYVAPSAFIKWRDVLYFNDVEEITGDYKQGKSVRELLKGENGNYADTGFVIYPKVEEKIEKALDVLKEYKKTVEAKSKVYNDFGISGLHETVNYEMKHFFKELGVNKPSDILQRIENFRKNSREQFLNWSAEKIVKNIYSEYLSDLIKEKNLTKNQKYLIENYALENKDENLYKQLFSNSKKNDSKKNISKKVKQ